VPTVVAVDLGGTNIRAAIFLTAEAKPTAIARAPTLAAEGPEAVIDRIIAAIQEVASGIEGGMRIGLGAPGPLDPKRGLVIEAPNLPGWVNIPLRDRLEQHFECPVALGNDANLAGLGEWRHGAGRGAHNLLYLTLSTGIGGGVIVDNRLLVGAHGLAAELGHMTVRPDGPLCGCGQRGHLEAVASGEAHLALFQNPPRVEQVQAVAIAGERMPQKSTFFYPKVLSGLVINPLDPTELAPTST